MLRRQHPNRQALRLPQLAKPRGLVRAKSCGTTTAKLLLQSPIQKRAREHVEDWSENRPTPQFRTLVVGHTARETLESSNLRERDY